MLLVHGVLHLSGFDHERGGGDLEEMAAAEARIMGALGWKGQGLIEAAGATGDSDDDGGGGGGGAAASSSTLGSTDSGDSRGSVEGGGAASDGSTASLEERAASGAKASTSSPAAWSADSILGRSSGWGPLRTRCGGQRRRPGA